MWVSARRVKGFRDVGRCWGFMVAFSLKLIVAENTAPRQHVSGAVSYSYCLNPKP